MKKSLEKFRKAEKYIAERDYASITDVLNDINKRVKNEFVFNPLLRRTREIADPNCFETITDYMIVKKINRLVFTDPEFFKDIEFYKLCCEAEGNVFLSDFGGKFASIRRLDLETMVTDKEKQPHIMRLIIEKLKKDNNYYVADIIMEELVWYAALKDCFLEEICYIAEQCVTATVKDFRGEEIQPWMWMYLELIISKDRTDLLDRAVRLIYGENSYDFTSIYCHSCYGMTYSEFIFLLYKRYCPEMSDGEILEKLLYSYSYTDRFTCASPDILKAEVDYILKQDFKVKNANCVFILWLSSHCKNEHLYRLLDKNSVLYLNDKWIELQSVVEEKKTNTCAFLAELLSTIPDISLSIDNYDTLSNGYLYFTARQLNKLFSIKKPVLTDKISANKIIRMAVVTKSKQLRTILNALEFNDERRDELIELCVSNQNTVILNFINKEWKKGGKPL